MPMHNRQLERSFNQGITLIELVAVILLISIVSVTVYPRLVSTLSIEAGVLRNDLITELRQAQLMAMNNSDHCYRVSIVSNDGFLIQHFGSRTAGGSCDGPIIRTDEKSPISSSTTVKRLSDNATSFSMDFLATGQILPPCSGDCIEVSSGNTVKIKIESQGYIHAG